MRRTQPPPALRPRFPRARLLIDGVPVLVPLIPALSFVLSMPDPSGGYVRALGQAAGGICRRRGVADLRTGATAGHRRFGVAVVDRTTARARSARRRVTWVHPRGVAALRAADPDDRRLRLRPGPLRGSSQWVASSSTSSRGGGTQSCWTAASTISPPTNAVVVSGLRPAVDGVADPRRDHRPTYPVDDLHADRQNVIALSPNGLFREVTTRPGPQGHRGARDTCG